MVCAFVTYLLFTIFVHTSLQAEPYNFQPEDRHIDVNEGDSFHTEFQEIGNQTVFGHCYIQSSSPVADYPILAPDNTTDDTDIVQTDDSRGFSYSDILGICGFSYENVDATVPLKWTMLAYDNITKVNFSEEVTVTLFYNMPLYLDTLVGLKGFSVANFYIPGSTKLETCILEFANTTVKIDMNAIKVYNNDVFQSRLSSLGGGRCGYKINNAKLTDPYLLTLYATDEQNKTYRNTSTLIVKTIGEKLQNRTLEVHLGDDVTVHCGKEGDASANSDQPFCHLYNPNGVLVSHAHLCDYKLPQVTMNDIGTWRCSVGYEYVMETLEYTTDLIEKKSEYVTTFAEDTADFYIIGCQLVNYIKSSVEYCKFTRPDGNIFKVTTGATTVNYNSFSTDLHNGKCSLEILKPLRNEDKGSWKCEAVFDDISGSSGGFIEVESPKYFLYATQMQHNVELGNNFVIDCMVPYSSDHCYIIAPNGSLYRPENRLQITTGLCSFKVEEATSSDNGTWKCSIAQKNGIPDEVIVVEISIINLKLVSDGAEAAENEDVELICNTNGIPIEYCRFVSPSELSYSLRKQNTVSTDRISYSGRGLEYGDCGIKITNVERTDGGQWNCHISPKRSDVKKTSDIRKNIELKIIPPRSPISIGDSLGIAFGVVAAIIIVGGFLFYKYARRSGDNVEEIVHRSERDSNDSSSGESVILAVGQSVTYSTQNLVEHTDPR